MLLKTLKHVNITLMIYSGEIPLPNLNKIIIANKVFHLLRFYAICYWLWCHEFFFLDIFELPTHKFPQIMCKKVGKFCGNMCLIVLCPQIVFQTQKIIFDLCTTFFPPKNRISTQFAFFLPTFLNFWPTNFHK